MQVDNEVRNRVNEQIVENNEARFNDYTVYIFKIEGCNNKKKLIITFC